jgi:hypothetical protein
MPSRQASFVIRVFITDTDQMAWGRLYHVPQPEGHYFRTWDELIALMQRELQIHTDDESGGISPAPSEPDSQSDDESDGISPAPSEPDSQ